MEKEEFKIIARTYCLKNSNSEDYDILLDGKKSFVIPIYQRPYSWGEENVKKLLQDLIDSYQSSNGEILCEAMFIGTMQLGKPSEGQYEVVDGQQRITTILLLLKVLSKYLEIISTTDWLKTDVNNGEQQKSLDEALEVFELCVEADLENNRYLQNLKIIDEFVKELIEKDPENVKEFSFDGFQNHIFSNVFFVVVETHAGLSKTIQIFNTINTTGLDLNGGDLFKIRMYEYLTSIKNQEQDVFIKISALYEKIERKNKELKKTINITHILHLYQYEIIAKYELSRSLHELNSTRFFDRLFDVIFGLADWPNFRKDKSIELSIEEIDSIIESRFEWEQISNPDLKVMVAHYFLRLSRYSKYWVLSVLFYHHFKNQDESNKNLFQFTILLSKLFLIYSIRFQKGINEIHRLSHELSVEIISKKMDDVFEKLENRIETNKENEHLKNLIMFNLTDNQRRKDIVCRIAAILYEDECQDSKSLNDTVQKLFNSKKHPVDIEHIQSYNDENVIERDEIKKKWGIELNGLGNLVVLERKINRSISNKKLKKEEGYEKSKYGIIKHIKNEISIWTIDCATRRREEQFGKIHNYFFTKS